MADRTSYIGGSDIGAIIGADGAFSTPLEVWERKCGFEPEQAPSTIMLLGMAAEPIILGRYARENDLLLERCIKLQDADVPYFRGEADAIAYGANRLGIDAKFTSKRDFGDALPQSWQAQGQWYMMLADAFAWDFAVIHSAYPDDMKTYRLFRDEDAIAFLRIEGAKFWESVQNKTPPKPAKLSEVTRYFKYASIEQKPMVVATSYVSYLVNKIAECKEAAKAAKDDEESKKLELAMLVGNTSEVRDQQNNIIARYSTNKNGVRSLKVSP